MCLPFWRYPFPPVHAGWPWMTNVRSWGIPGINCPARLSPAFPHHKTPNFPQLSQLEVHTFKKLSWYHHVIGNHQKNEVFFATKTLWWDYDCSRDPAESKYHFPIRCAASVATSVQAFQVQKKSMAKTRSKDPQKKSHWNRPTPPVARARVEKEDPCHHGNDAAVYDPQHKKRYDLWNVHRLLKLSTIERALQLRANQHFVWSDH